MVESRLTMPRVLSAPDERARPWGEAILWSIALSALFVVVYGQCNAAAASRLDVGTWFSPWELHIPFVPVLIVPYMSIDLFFVASFLLCSNRSELRILAKRIALAVAVAGICFLLFPLRIGFPRPEVSGWTGSIFHFLWSFDKPYNLVPSLHVALLSILWGVYVRHTSGLLRRAVQGWFVLIGASTLLTWQHHVADVATGFVLAFVCFQAFPGARGRGRIVTPAGKGRVLARPYAIGAALSALAAFAAWPLGAVLLWPAAALAAVAAAYLGLGPRVFGTSGGRLALGSRALLAPYLLGARLSLLLYSRRTPAYAKVTDEVYLGRRLDAREAGALARDGVTAVLDLTAEFSESRPLTALAYGNVRILDLMTPTVEQLAEGVDFIRRHAASGAVYVHCALGFSRSACVVAAYLLASDPGLSVDEAVRIVRRARPRVVLPRESIEALHAYVASSPQF